MTAQDLAQIQEDRLKEENLLERKEAMERLLDNKDFQDLFLEDFLIKGALNMARLIQHESVKDEYILERYRNKLVAIGVIKNFIDAVVVEGRDSEEAIVQIDKLITGVSDE